MSLSLLPGQIRSCRAPHALLRRCPSRLFNTACIRSSTITGVVRFKQKLSWPHHCSRCLSSFVNATAAPHENMYVPQPDLEDLEKYRAGGYHPIVLGDTFNNGRYRIVHKLGSGGHSTIWLAQDEKRTRYVSLKALAASEADKSEEGAILRHLHRGEPSLGMRFMPDLLDEFSIEGPNGRHICLVQEVTGRSVAGSKEDSISRMFPVEAARSIAAQLIMGLSHIHARGVCHGDLHLQNIMLRGPHLHHLSPETLREQYGVHNVPVRRVDGRAVEPHAPPYAVFPLHIDMPADELSGPLIQIIDYGTSFRWPTRNPPELHSPPLYLPPEDFFKEPITPAADIWALGISLYEILGERSLFEGFTYGQEDMVGDAINMLGLPQARWWDKWIQLKEASWLHGASMHDMRTVQFSLHRPLQQRLWQMGRGETTETCEWDVEGGEMRALEELLRSMLRFEPSERATAEELLASGYMVEWAMPAWERQSQRTG